MLADQQPPRGLSGGRSSYSAQMADGDSSVSGKPLPVAPETEHELGHLRQYVPGDLLDVSFPVSVRGYERGAVDAYTRRVNRVIAELKVTGSPPAAVRHALDQAGEKVDGLLQAAREAADQITTSAREEAQENADLIKAEAVKFVVDRNAEADRLKAEADELSAKAKADAEATLAKANAEASEVLGGAKAQAQDTITRSQAEADERRRRLEGELAALREEAEARLRELQADTQAVWRERDQTLEGIRAMANDLGDIAKASVDRLQPDQPAGPHGENAEAGTANHDEPTVAATDEPASAVPAAGAHGGSGESERGG
jgi:cell division septum initiation protein DivIVA